MSQRRHIAVVAAAATLLASMPLSTVFISWTWLVDCVLVVTVVAGTAMLVRATRAPLAVQVAAMACALVLFLTWLFPSGHEMLGFLPGAATVRHFGELLNEAGTDMRDYAVPVPDRPGLLFLTTLGVGAVALLVDLVTMGLRRPALAGLPMLAIYSVPVAVHEDSVSFIPFAIAAAGFLWLLVTDNVDRVRRFGRRFTGDGRDVDLWEPSPLAAAGRRLAVIGVVAAILVPALIPGMTGGLLDRFGSPNGSGPGIGPGGRSSVNLFTRFSGQLNLDKTVKMLTVSTDDPKPYYMTLATASDLTMTGFHARPPSSGRSVTGDLPRVDTDVDGISAQRYHATVTIQTLDMGYLPIYQQLVATQKLDRSWRYDEKTRDVYSTRSTSRGKKYSFDYVHLRFEPTALDGAAPLSSDDPVQRQYTETPFIKTVSDLVGGLTKGKSTPYQKVQAIYKYLSSNDFTYQLSTRETTGGDIVAFLKNKRGYCEQYAAAMAWLVRAANIPARVALGFSRGGSAASPYVLTNRNLHAWTEVYFKGFGWVPFDATPSAGVAGSVAPVWAPDSRAAALGIPPSNDDIPSRGNLGATPGGDPSLAPHGAPLPTGSAATPNRQGIPWGLVVLLVAVFLAVLAMAPAVRRVVLRRRRTPARGAPPATAPPPSGAGPPVVVTAPMAVQSSRQDAHAAWSELMDTMIDFRLPLDPAETPRSTTARLIREAHLPPPAAEAATLLRLAQERALYARDPLVGAGLGEALRTVRAAIAGRVSLRTRLVAALLPPSVLMRWRVAAIEKYTAATARTGAVRDTVLRAASPRRLLAGRASR